MSLRARAPAAALAALVMLAGLTGCNRRPVDDSPVLARVNDGVVTRAELDYVKSHLPANGAASAPSDDAILARLVSEHIAAQQSEKDKLDRNPGVMQALESARREALARYYAEHLRAAASAPTDADVHKYYDEHPELFAQRKIYLLQRVQARVPAEREQALIASLQAAKSADEVAAQVKAVAPNAEVAQTPQAAETLPPGLLRRVAMMQPGQTLISPGQGAVAALTLLRSDAAPVGFDQVSVRLQQALLEERRRAALVDERTRLRKLAKIEYLGAFAASAPAPGAAAPPTAPPVPAPAASGAH